MIKNQHVWFNLLQTSIKINQSNRNWNFINLATIELEQVQVRTIVFRGFIEINNKKGITFCTDARSNKFLNQNKNNSAQISWYLPQEMEQFRLSGELIMIGKENHNYICNNKNLFNNKNENNIVNNDNILLEERKKLWSNLSVIAQNTFKEDSKDKNNLASATLVGASDVKVSNINNNIPYNFIFCVLYPNEVDYLSLKNNIRHLHNIYKNSIVDIKP
jgi:hypothetical protein